MDSNPVSFRERNAPNIIPVTHTKRRDKERGTYVAGKHTKISPHPSPGHGSCREAVTSQANRSLTSSLLLTDGRIDRRDCHWRFFSFLSVFSQSLRAPQKTNTTSSKYPMICKPPLGSQKRSGPQHSTGGKVRTQPFVQLASELGPRPLGRHNRGRPRALTLGVSPSPENRTPEDDQKLQKLKRPGFW